MNMTFPTSALEITEGCFKWCEEQHFTHQRNLEIYELSFIAIALVSLGINHLIYNHSDFLKEISGMNEYQISKVYDGTHFLAFMMLVAYIIYMVLLR